jgi:hypothetical protein
MTLSEINVYPIKSAKGISLQTAFIERRGIQFDHRWMVVDDAGVFLSQRVRPRLALVTVRIGADYLYMNAPGMDTLTISSQPRETRFMGVKVWDDVVQAISTGDESKIWFSEFLGISCQLVFMPEESLRPIEPGYALNGDIVSFADAFPLLLISQSSLDDLNSRLAKPVPMNRFRPNIVVKDCSPFDEDNWKKIKIGGMVLRLAKSCSRCITTTVDQETGIQGKEPLATLSQYRKVDGEVHFGQNVIPENSGMLRIGDSVEIIE